MYSIVNFSKFNIHNFAKVSHEIIDKWEVKLEIYIC